MIHGHVVSVSEDMVMRIWNESLSPHFEYQFSDVLTDVVLAKDAQGNDVMLLSSLGGSLFAFNIGSG